jgi:hypothetical protein
VCVWSVEERVWRKTHTHKYPPIYHISQEYHISHFGCSAIGFAIDMPFMSSIRWLASRENIYGGLVLLFAISAYLVFRIQYTYSFLVDDVYQVQSPRELYVSERYTIRYVNILSTT